MDSAAPLYLTHYKLGLMLRVDVQGPGAAELLLWLCSMAMIPEASQALLPSSVSSWPGSLPPLLTLPSPPPEHSPRKESAELTLQGFPQEGYLCDHFGEEAEERFPEGISLSLSLSLSLWSTSWGQERKATLPRVRPGSWPMAHHSDPQGLAGGYF